MSSASARRLDISDMANAMKGRNGEWNNHGRGQEGRQRQNRQQKGGCSGNLGNQEAVEGRATSLVGQHASGADRRSRKVMECYLL